MGNATHARETFLALRADIAAALGVPAQDVTILSMTQTVAADGRSSNLHVTFAVRGHSVEQCREGMQREGTFTRTASANRATVTSISVQPRQAAAGPACGTACIVGVSVGALVAIVAAVVLTAVITTKLMAKRRRPTHGAVVIAQVIKTPVENTLDPEVVATADSEYSDEEEPEPAAAAASP